VLKKWVENNNHFIVVGPEGCGKGMLIREAFVGIRKTMKINFSTIYCNSQTNANHIIQKLYQICLKGNSGGGKILRPK
jgi:dynein heavy chain 2